MKNLILFLVLLVSATGVAQSIDYNKIILPVSAGADIEFGERLVQLAWKNNPLNSMVRKQVDLSGLDVKISRRQWIENVQVIGNLNQFILDPTSDLAGRANFYPKYNFSARLSLGMLLVNPIQTRRRRQEMDIAMDQVNAQKLEVRRQVLETYNNFLTAQEIYKIQTTVFQDAESSHQISEAAFKQGELTYEQYILDLNNYNRIKIAKLNAERDYQNIKLGLEALIGLKLEDVPR